MALFDALDSDLDDVAARCTDDDAGVRRVAMLELAEVTDEGAVPLLIKGLGDADPAVREAAAKALDEHSGEGIVVRAGQCARRPGRRGARGRRGNAGGEEGCPRARHF